ncbi:methionine aminopeptidase, type I [Friedmanniella luteola]|uniref:Methionine aminopeptidase n=1 Tax=Friedmanniella luteola TaxID=546871 RepID=A0A1H1YZH4_9ACTN|nr:type I methionyl aminopeptidase [Friedmanniella luteola]SDT26722.1 methionine aminopeptidase, type I [Friedmanniella luteola]
MFGTPRGVEIKTREQLLLMRRAGLVVAAALAATRAAVRPGVSTRELDAVAAEVIRSAGATPSFLDYGAHEGIGGFQGVTCLSVNEEVVHGVPGHRVLVEGDLLSIDCGAVVEGWHGDSAVTVAVGEVAPELRALSGTTRSALWHGIAAARLGGHVGDISAAVEAHVRASDAGYGIVEEYVGHGIGSAMHQPPDVPNVVARGVLPGRGRGPKIVEGLALAVEPMLTLGSPDNHVLADDWTVVTDDGRPAAHWEHTMTVTEHGLWVLTAEDGGAEMLGALGVPFGPLAD